jgi:Lrp/AsnC family transcriptional regulator, leucine-responsive regulatory protein
MTKKIIDGSDLRLLAKLQTDALATIEELGRAAGLSASSAQRHVRRLRHQKVIVADLAIVDPKALGFNLTMLVELEVENDKPDLQLALNRWISKTPEIQNAWHITGRGDYMLSIIARSIEHFDELISALMQQNPIVRKYTTSLALKTLKRSMAVPTYAKGHDR